LKEKGGREGRDRIYIFTERETHTHQQTTTILARKTWGEGRGREKLDQSMYIVTNYVRSSRQSDIDTDKYLYQ